MNNFTNELLEEAQSLLQQLRSVVLTMDDSMYTLESPLLSNASIGAHVRHTLEFFKCYQDGLGSGEINYDLRKRNLDIEINRAFAVSTIDQVSQSFAFATTTGKLELKSQGCDGTIRIMQSSKERELWYTIEHAIHHLAIIKIGILHQAPAFPFPENFGVASSTVIFQQMRNQ